MPDSDAPPVTVHNGRPDLTQAVHTAYAASQPPSKSSGQVYGLNITPPPHTHDHHAHDVGNSPEREGGSGYEGSEKGKAKSASGGGGGGGNMRDRHHSRRGAKPKTPLNIWAAGPGKMNSVVYAAARALPLSDHIGIFPMAYEL